MFYCWQVSHWSYNKEICLYLILHMTKYSLFFFFIGQKIRINYYFQSKSYCLRVSLYVFSHIFSYYESHLIFFFFAKYFQQKNIKNNQLILFSFQLLSIILSAKKKLDKLFPNIKYLLLSLEGSNGKEKKKIFQLYFTYQPIVCFVCCYYISN